MSHGLTLFLVSSIVARTRRPGSRPQGVPKLHDAPSAEPGQRVLGKRHRPGGERHPGQGKRRQPIEAGAGRDLVFAFILLKASIRKRAAREAGALAGATQTFRIASPNYPQDAGFKGSPEGYQTSPCPALAMVGPSFGARLRRKRLLKRANATPDGLRGLFPGPLVPFASNCGRFARRRLSPGGRGRMIEKTRQLKGESMLSQREILIKMSNDAKLAELRARTNQELLVLIERELDCAASLADVGDAEKAYRKVISLLPKAPDMRQGERARIEEKIRELGFRLEQVPVGARAQRYSTSYGSGRMNALPVPAPQTCLL
jgi:hypothetical protein